MRPLRFSLGLAVVLVAGALAAVPTAGGATTPRRCRTSDFKVTPGHGFVALSHYRRVVRLQNVSHSTCAVSGWFKVKLLSAGGHVLPSTEQHITADQFGNDPKHTVTLKPGGRASFAIDTRAPVTSCPYTKAAAVTAPLSTGSKKVSVSVLACAHFAVIPVQPDHKAAP